MVGHFGRVCQGGRRQPRGGSRSLPSRSPGSMAVQVDLPVEQPHPQVNTSAVHDYFEPAPTIVVRMTALNGSVAFPVLPDSGADISVAGPDVLKSLNDHPDNLLPSSVKPRAVNGTSMSPIGKLPVSISLGDTEYSDVLHIYPQVKGALLSWKAARGLKILPESYPHPPPSSTPLSVSSHCRTHPCSRRPYSQHPPAVREFRWLD